MLTRRIFQQLTDSVLLSRSFRPTCICNVKINKVSQQHFPNSFTSQSRCASSSSTRWKSRQSRDRYAKEAKVQGLKSRAAFKLLEINDKYSLFKPGQTVIDLGYAPGSWSQVAQNRTAPNGRVIGIDILPVQPPKGVSTIQGNFLSPEIQEEVRAYVQDPQRGRVRKRAVLSRAEEEKDGKESSEVDIEDAARGYIDMERHASLDTHESTSSGENTGSGGRDKRLTLKERDEQQGRVVDVVLSDMSAPWDQTTGLWIKSVSDPYHRMMNTSGVSFRDHAGSMDLCMAALSFSVDTLRTGGHFLCKFYQGAEDKAFELRLKKLFEKVHREKPDSSRSASHQRTTTSKPILTIAQESKEAYFVGLRRKETATREEVLN